jgi:hypothetical protein
VACEELDLGKTFCEPASAEFARLVDLNLVIGDHRGVHFRLGSTLHCVFREAGFAQPQVTWNQPVVLRGEGKRLLRLSYEEFAPALVREGLAEAGEVRRVDEEMQALEADEGVLFGMPPVGQVWATV